MYVKAPEVAVLLAVQTFGNTCAPVACLTCGNGVKPSGSSPRVRISSEVTPWKLATAAKRSG
jgi:hypothetical protein